jgi:hypothetical protein
MKNIFLIYLKIKYKYLYNIMKNAALLLSGSLRQKKNIKQIQHFIENHKNYKFYLFICSYDIEGFTRKFDNVNVIESKKLDKNIFNKFNVAKIKIKNFNKINKKLTKIYENNFEQIINSKKCPIMFQDKKRFINYLGQCYMNYINLLEVKKYKKIEFDIIIKSRFDMKSNSILKIENDLQDYTIYSYVNKKLFNNKFTYKNQIIDDKFYYCSLNNIQKLIDVYNYKTWLNLFQNEKDYYQKEKGNDIETYLTHYYFNIQKLKSYNIQFRPQINRKIK